MTELRIRRAAAADVAAVVDLVESAYRGERSRAGWTTEADLLDGQRTDAASVTEAVERPSTRVLLAVGRTESGGDELLGCCELDDRGGGLAYFGMFAVRPDRQAGGIGRRLLDAAEDTARAELGARVMEMTVIRQRVELVAWYERRGYRLTGETRPFPYGDVRFGEPQRPDLHFVVLRKAL